MERPMDAKEQRHLERLLETHRSNLRQLEEQAAAYGINVPLPILNGIKHERGEIARIEALVSMDEESIALSRQSTWESMPAGGERAESKHVKSVISTVGVEALDYPDDKEVPIPWAKPPFARGWYVVLIVVGVSLAIVLVWFGRWGTGGAVVSGTPSTLTQPAISTLPIDIVTFDFEDGLQGWDTSESKSKLATLEVTSDLRHGGQKALRLSTELYGNASSGFVGKHSQEVYQHTEVKVSFSQATRAGMHIADHIDLTGRPASCYVYLPAQIAVEGPPARITMVAKDTNQRNYYGSSVDITSTQVKKWFPISLIVGTGFQEAGFDQTQVGTLGIRIDVPNGSKLSYRGPIFIDNCTIYQL